MIQLADQQLKAWVQGIVGELDVHLLPPASSHTGTGVNLYLMELADSPPARTGGAPPLQFALRYLVTTWADDPEEEHRLLGELTFAAMEDGDLDVDLTPLSAETWAAFGMAPRPAFILRVPIRKPRPEQPTKRVTAPLVVRTTPMTQLFGQVIGPGDVPMVGVAVELPALQLVQRTDREGRFHFSAVPEEPRRKVLRVRLDGREQQVRTEDQTSEVDPLVIRFDLTAQ